MPTSEEIFTHIKIRRDTLSNWVKENPILLLGEFSLVTDLNRIKAGNGVTKWNDLPYIDDDAYKKLERLIKLVFNTDKEVVIKGSVDKYSDIYVNYPRDSNNNDDIVYVISENNFYKYNESTDTWILVTKEDIGANINYNSLINIINEQISLIIVDDLTNTDSNKLLSANQGYVLDNKIKDLSNDVNEKYNYLLDTAKNIYDTTSVYNKIYVNQNTGQDSIANGTPTKPFKTLKAAIDYIPITVNRNTHTIITIILTSNIGVNEYYTLPSINGISRLIIDGGGFSINFSNNTTNAFEIGITNTPITFNNITLNFTGDQSYGVVCAMGSKVNFDTCKLVATTNNLSALLKTDPLCNIYVEQSEINGTRNNIGIHLINSYSIIKNTKFTGVNYGVGLNCSFCILEGNTYSVYNNYYYRLDNAEVIA